MEKSKRLFYERPQLEVVELTVKTCLLSGSSTTSPRDDYDEETDNPFGES